MLVGITQRIGALESRMNKLERKTSNGNDTRIKKLAADVKTLAGHLAGITQGLNNTPDYNLREEFQCDHCGSKGTVATKHRCTNCEKEGWWGWWPKKKR
jgi:DnaJ-class molecular chaperone